MKLSKQIKYIILSAVVMFCVLLFIGIIVVCADNGIYVDTALCWYLLLILIGFVTGCSVGTYNRDL